jgi:PAS domain S-box-containing protein
MPAMQNLGSIGRIPIAAGPPARERTADRTMAEESLRESEMKYREVLESIEEGYYEVDIGGNLVFFNDSLFRMLGYSHQELMGMNNRKYMTPETAQKVYQTFSEVYRTGSSTKMLNWELVRKDGSVRYIEASVSPIRNRGAITGFRGICRDNTEAKLSEKARERAINHLAHELGTPMAIIDGVLGRISNRIQGAGIADIDQTLQRGVRSIGRLREIQNRVEDILNLDPCEEKERLIPIFMNALGILEEVREEGDFDRGQAAVFRAVLARLESLFEKKKIFFEKIHIEQFIGEVCEEVLFAAKGRDLEIVRNLPSDSIISMDRDILKKVCLGILKNAVQNTPDEGKIEVKAVFHNNGVQIHFIDYGIGITAENQKMVFGGFFHTVDTSFYASKKQYLFNAGGAGADLLRIKVLAERHDFSVAMKSARCRFIPSDLDLCPGKISSCSSVNSREECFASGGSAFSITLPHDQPQMSESRDGR